MNKKWIQAIAILFCGMVIILAYVWFISVGLWTSWPPTTNYYDRLANSFREGHLYVDAQIDPVLLKLPDPYEPDARKSIHGLEIDQPNTIWDMALYEGKIYLYWGPVPALMLSVIKFFYRKEIGDQVLTFFFISGLFFFECIFLLKVWRRFYPNLPFLFVLLAIFLVGFINPTLWVLSIPRIYEAAIASDQFFFVGGIYFAFSGLDRPVKSAWRLSLAGLFWICSIGSRATMAIPISFLVLTIISILLLRDLKSYVNSSSFKQFASFAIPFFGGGAGLAWYNQARFGSVFEFGFKYEITMLNQNKLQNVLFSPIYSLPNLYLYLLNPPSINSLFPFVKPVWDGGFISNFNNYFHTIYNAERITGLIFVFPFSIFTLIVLWRLISYALNKWRRRTSKSANERSDVNNDLINMLLIGFTGSLVLEFLTVSIIFYGTMRYLMDAMPTLALLSIFGFWQGYSTNLEKPIGLKIYTVLGLTLLIISVLFGILLAFSSDVTRIRANNPALLNHLRLFFIQIINKLVK